MKTAYVISGRLTEQGTLELDETLPLPPGPVRVAVESAVDPDFPPAPGEAPGSRKARMEAAIGCVSDEDARRMLETIEAEFERVDLNDWR